MLLGSEKALRATGLVQSSQSVWVCSAQSWGFTQGFVLRARGKVPSRSATGTWEYPEEMH